MERVCIFIDGSNFYHAVKSAGWPPSVDFQKLAKALVGADRRHEQTYYYNTPLLAPKPGATPIMRRKTNSDAGNNDFSMPCVMCQI